MNQLTRHCLFVIFWPTTPYSPDLVPCDFFLFPKRKWPIKERRFATKKNFAGRSQDYAKKCLSEVLQGLKKALTQVYYIWRELFWREQYRYWWINKYFSRKIKFQLIFEEPTYFSLLFHFISRLLILKSSWDLFGLWQESC